MTRSADLGKIADHASNPGDAGSTRATPGVTGADSRHILAVCDFCVAHLRVRHFSRVSPQRLALEHADIRRRERSEIGQGLSAAGYRPETLQRLQDGVIGLVCRIFNGGVDVFAFEEGIIS